MLRKAVFAVLQTLLFLLFFGVGSFLPAFTSIPLWQTTLSPGHFFVWNGVVLVFAAYLVILLVEAVRRRLRGPGGLTTLAFALALALGLAIRLPFKST